MVSENGNSHMNKINTKGKSFGMASDYYRVRLLRVDEELPADFEWRDDILYASPKAYPSKLKVTYRIQLLPYDGSNSHEIAILRDKREAKIQVKTIKRNLQDLTKMGFDDKYGIRDTSVQKRIEAMTAEEQTIKNVNAEGNSVILFAGVCNDREHED